jgi:hypothetical protein
MLVKTAGPLDLQPLHLGVCCALCVPAAFTRDTSLAAKLHVSGPTGEEATAPSPGGSAGSNPVGATTASCLPPRIPSQFQNVPNVSGERLGWALSE